MKVPGRPKRHKRSIFVTREQIEFAMKNYTDSDAHGLREGQSGWYRFEEYCTAFEMRGLELIALSNRIRQLEGENQDLRDTYCIEIAVDEISKIIDESGGKIE